MFPRKVETNLDPAGMTARATAAQFTHGPRPLRFLMKT